MAVFVERSIVRARLKSRKPLHQKTTMAPSAAPGSALNKLGLDLRSSLAGLTKGTSNITNSSMYYEEVVPEIEGVLVVTPRAIERYQLNGTIVKKAALPEAITAFLGTKVAGVGRVFLCGTQVGENSVVLW